MMCAQFFFVYGSFFPFSLFYYTDTILRWWWWPTKTTNDDSNDDETNNLIIAVFLLIVGPFLEEYLQLGSHGQCRVMPASKIESLSIKTSLCSHRSGLHCVTKGKSYDFSYFYDIFLHVTTLYNFYSLFAVINLYVNFLHICWEGEHHTQVQVKGVVTRVHLQSYCCIEPIFKFTTLSIL